MGKAMTGNNFLRKTTKFISVNGPYLFICELGRRVGIVFRRLMLARKLGCPDISIGPRCYLRGLTCIHIGKKFRAGEGLWMEAIVAYNQQSFSPSIVIGDNVSVSHWVHIAATHKVQIEDGVLIGSKVLITDHNHGQYRNGTDNVNLAPSLRLLDQDRIVVIGKNTWLGDGAVVMPGVTIGEGCVIGANAVVTQDIPPFTVAAGIPAKVLSRFEFSSQTWRKL
ncbi:DapH/DapD/GlmU-related protein (plasmid) [Telmatobacter bradus]|uniref:DapH/DapD/GlmU-related protein n=1 Tax=Telmatobacter bradus TaxID=474953 RepID=UPI003B43B0C2